jgi:signal transduction histidine kinase
MTGGGEIVSAGEGESFEEYLAKANVSGARLAYGLSAVLMPAGVVLDWVAHPDRARAFLVIRIAAGLIAATMVPVCSAKRAERYPVLLGFGPPLICAGAIALMIAKLDGYASSYYAGLNLCILAVGVLYTWHWRYSALICTLIIAMWIAPAANLVLGNGRFDVAIFANNLYFLLLTSVIAVSSSVIRFRLAKNEFLARTELGRTSSELASTLLQLQELDRFKSEFFSNITHELKTPLTMILAPLELMIQGEMGSVSESQRASLQSMLRSGIKLLKLIGDLLDLAKLDESRVRLQIGEHDLVRHLGELCAEVQPLAQRKSIELTFESNVQACPTHCDIERLERVFVNLLSNAAKFTPAEGKIRILLLDTGPSVRISVMDNGIGFPQEMADRVFERFFQVDMGDTRKVGGTGIGLSLARELVLLHGGTISAESVPSGGAKFIVELLKDREHFDPDSLDRRAQREDRVLGNRASDHSVGDWHFEGKSRLRLIEIDEATDQRVVDRDPDEHERAQSVLVVEDTPDVIRVIHLALRTDFRILAAPNGPKGLALAVKHLPSLVITDLMMPEMDGNELTRRLRADPRTRHIPIVMLTARGDLGNRVAGLEAGVNAYLTKPFSTTELMSTVRGLVRIQETAADLLMTHNMDSLETIAGGLAHEINNPLNYIKSALTLIRGDAEVIVELTGKSAEAATSAPALALASSRMTKMFEVANSGLRRIGATVALMQRYSREGYTRTQQPFDVFQATRDVVSMLQACAAEPMFETSFEGDSDIECVPEEFNQILTNLVQNAIDAVPRDGTGRIRVTGTNDGANLVLSVQDNGVGIRSEDRNKIFTPFYTTKDVGAGMGLGLTIVHRVVTSLGGTVTVTSNLGAGSEFTLRIPRKRVAAGTSAGRPLVT